MQDFMIALLICSVTMSALALFYMAITPLLAKRYSVTGRYYTWIVIVVGLIIPLRPRFSNAIIKVHMPAQTTVSQIPTGTGTPVTPAGENALSPVLTNVSWLQIAAAVWLTGMILFITYHIVKHYRFLKMVDRWSNNITDEQTLTILHNLKAQMGIPTSIGLQCCDSIGTPMMTGFFKPRILLPNTGFSKGEKHFILKHELVHYKRKDLWYKCLVLGATAIHWFNPIVYLMAKAIDTQCELSCDTEVVRNASADMRHYYSITIIGVIRYQSNLKTALSTNFYKGKKSIKERIILIMDMRKKKAGLAVLGGVLTLTLGTGFAFGAKAETQNPPQTIQEDIKVSPDFSYKFLPDPNIYSQYSSYGITISDDGEKLLYNGKRVRLFVDEQSEDQAFFLDDAGTIDLTVTRNADGNITGLESISESKAQEYRFSFFDDNINAAISKNETITAQDAERPQDTTTVQDTTIVEDKNGRNKYEQYSAYGISLSSDGNVLQYNGQRVRLFVDKLSDGSYEAFWTDKDGAINISVVRNSAGKITAIDTISEKQAQKYYTAADNFEYNTLSILN